MTDPGLPGAATPSDDGAFETLLWELVLRFVDLPADQVDGEIRSAQRRICEALDLDRSAMWQVAQDDAWDMCLTHVYERRGAAVPIDELTGIAADRSSRVFPLAHAVPYPASARSKETFPWVTSRVHAGLTTVIPSAGALPAEAAVDAGTLRRVATVSTVIVPLKTETGVLGCMSFASTVTTRPWSDALVRRFELLAQVLSRALNAKRASRIERENYARLESAAAFGGVGLWELDITTGLIRATNAARRLFGFSPEDVLSVEAVLARVHPDDVEPYRRRLALFLSEQGSYTQDYRLLLPDGTIRWISSRGKPFASSPGAPPDRVFGASIDITDRKRGEEALRTSEEVNRATFEQAAVGISHVAADGSWLRVNDKLCAILGYRREELVGGMTFQDLTHPEDLTADVASAREILAGRRTTYSVEKRYVRRNGSVIWANLTVSLVRDDAGRPKHFISIVEDITERKRMEEQLRIALADLQQLRDQLQLDNRSLRDEVQRRGGVPIVVGTSAPIRAALELADQVAPTSATVLLLGETGTGKERFANYIHEHSPRHGRTMVRVNCAAIPATLIESELFGREKGAFTGALARQIGRFELANGSTIFLDEIGDLPPEVQVKLLRVIEERCVERLGNPRPVPVDVRIIAATHRDLQLAVREGQFREDLYYRLNVFPIVLPPLRERLEDIPLLARAMIDELARTMGRRFEPLSQDTLMALRRYPWPGNIRELRNVLERGMITSTASRLQVAIPVADAERERSAHAPELKDVERAHILDVLGQTGWRIRGSYGAAAILGLPPTTLENRMKRLGISRPRPDGK